MNPLVSIGIPTYNNPDGLYKTLNCIAGQSYKNLEIIVSDNASPDIRVQEVLAAFMAGDNRIRKYRQEKDIGVDMNYIFVRQQATGKYFMWAQDDDWWSNRFIERLVEGLESNPDIPVAMCPACYSLKDGKMSSQYTLQSVSVFNTIGNGEMGLVCMGLWQRDKIERFEVHLPIYVLGGDHITVAHVILAHKKVIIVPTELYIKGYKPGRFQVCFNNDFWYSYRSWWWMMKILIESEHIPLKRKLLLPVVAITNFVRATGVTGVQIAVSLPEGNPIRTAIQKRFFGAN